MTEHDKRGTRADEGGPARPLPERSAAATEIALPTDQPSLPPATAFLTSRHFPRGPQGNLSLQGPLGHAPSAQMFLDTEIRAVYMRPESCNRLVDGNPSLQSMRVSYGSFADPRDPGRTLHLLPQFQWHGSGYAISEMLKLDRGVSPNLAALVFKNIDDGISMETRLRESMIPARHEWRQDVEPLSHLRKLVNQFGSTVVQLNGELGQHFVIVDHIDDLAGVAQIREPYHGWAIAVELDGLRKRLDLNGPGLQYLVVDEHDPAMQAAQLNKSFDDFLATRPVLHRICGLSGVIRSLAVSLYDRWHR